MKTHTSDFKQGIKSYGRQLKSLITYTENNTNVTLSNEELNSVSPNYEGNILKSVMKQLVIDSNVDIPLNTILRYQLGLKIGSQYEYIDFGNYVVYKSEKQEDTKSYKITCYDKMLYSMKDYEDMNIVYPITIRDYINTMCTYLGLVFKNYNDEFANYDKQIQNELYLDTDGNSLGYTFRDVFDELAQVTASTICLDLNNQVEIRYITDTNDTINEEYFKDANVNIGEKYGKVNSIVLSRANSDNVYLRDEESVAENGLCEIKINDNQIMNFNDRATYLPDILEELDGLEFYLNDFSSTGIVYYDLCDRYSISIRENTYSCVMLNDEINVTQGLEENIHTELLEQSETDYSKADKTDRLINSVYFIVDKQNAEIEAIAERVADVSKTITGNGSITLENAHAGILHYLEIEGDLHLLYPSDNLFPSDDLYIRDFNLIVDDNAYHLDINYLNYTSESLKDTYIYEDGTQRIIRRVAGIGGNPLILPAEEKEDIEIRVKSDSIIYLESFSNAKFKCTYLLENQYTDYFATQVDVKSEINVTAGQIEEKVSQVADENGDVTSASIILAINKDESSAEINADKISLEGKKINLTSDNIEIDSNNFKVDEEGNIFATGGDIAGFAIDEDKGLVKYIYAPYDYTQDDIDRLIEILRGTITPTQEDYDKYDFDDSGVFNSSDLVNIVWYINTGITTTNPGKFVITAPPSSKRLFSARMGFYNGYNQLINGLGHNGGFFTSLGIKSNNSINSTSITPNYIQMYSNDVLNIEMYSETGNIKCVSLTQTSLEKDKKDFEEFNNGLETLKKIDIYKYHLKNEDASKKKHIGFVIGEDYNYSDEVTSNDNDGVDIYSFVSLCCQAIKEQQVQIEELKKEISKLKGEK